MTLPEPTLPNPSEGIRTGRSAADRHPLLSKPWRAFVERAWWMLVYGLIVLTAADAVGSWRGWLVVVGMTFMAAMYVLRDAQVRAR